MRILLNRTHTHVQTLISLFNAATLCNLGWDFSRWMNDWMIHFRRFDLDNSDQNERLPCATYQLTVFYAYRDPVWIESAGPWMLLVWPFVHSTHSPTSLPSFASVGDGDRIPKRTITFDVCTHSYIAMHWTAMGCALYANWSFVKYFSPVQKMVCVCDCCPLQLHVLLRYIFDWPNQGR